MQPQAAAGLAFDAGSLHHFLCKDGGEGLLMPAGKKANKIGTKWDLSFHKISNYMSPFRTIGKAFLLMDYQ